MRVKWGAMLKAFPLLLLVAISTNAVAEWVKFSETEQGTTVYVDPNTIRRSGKKVKMWNMLDFKKTQVVAEVPFRSTKALHEYDCKEERFRMMSLSVHSNNLGLGNTVHSDSDPKQWTPISPTSLESSLLEYVCKKR